MRHTGDSFPDLIGLALVTIAIYFALQAIIVVTHEYAHSTAAWLLGYTATPFTVVWGNPITITGWDERVADNHLFRSPGNPADAVIGGIPLFLHAAFAALGLFLLRQRLPTRRKLLFYSVHLFVVVNLTELVAHILMRPWVGSGATGRFHEGLRLSPWPLFLVGSAILALAFGVFCTQGDAEARPGPGRERKKALDGGVLHGFRHVFVGKRATDHGTLSRPTVEMGLIGVFGFLGWIPAAGFRTLPSEVEAEI